VAAQSLNRHRSPTAWWRQEERRTRVGKLDRLASRGQQRGVDGSTIARHSAHYTFSGMNASERSGISQNRYCA
jgi:hypothetical protein